MNRFNSGLQGGLRAAGLRWFLKGAIAASMLHNGISIAQDPSLVSNDEDTSDWTFMLGAGTSYGPSYIGSNKLKAEAFSLVLLEYKDLFYVRGDLLAWPKPRCVLTQRRTLPAGIKRSAPAPDGQWPAAASAGYSRLRN